MWLTICEYLLHRSTVETPDKAYIIHLFPSPQVMAEKEQGLAGQVAALQEQQRADAARLQAAERELQFELKASLLLKQE